jgi:hypothetical protein
MPVVRYFVFVGGALLALLFAMNAFLAPPLDTDGTAQASQAAASEPDLAKPYLRIRSAQKPPERVVIDTSLPTVVPAATVIAAAPVAVSKPAALDALAQIEPSDIQKSELKRIEPKVAPRRKVAKRQVSQPVMASVQARVASAQAPMAYAQAPRFDFDFFGRN